MKAKRKLIALSVVILTFMILTVAIGAASATKYTGTVNGAEEKIAAFDKAATLTSKQSAMDRAIDYFVTVDPESEGYDTLVKKLDVAMLRLAVMYLGTVNENDTANARNLVIDNIEKNLDKHMPPQDTKYTENGAEVTYSQFYLQLTELVRATVETYYTECVAADSAAVKETKIDSLLSLITAYKLDMGDEFDQNLLSENLITAELYLSAVNKQDRLSKYGASLRKLKAFVASHEFDTECDEYKTLAKKYGELVADYDAKYNAAREELSNLAHYVDYSYDILYNMTFDLGEDGKLHDLGTFTEELKTEGDIELTRMGIESGMDGDNRYYTTHYDMAKHFRPNAYISSASDSLVVEFDITTFSTLPDNEMYIEDRGSYSTASWTVCYLIINSEGDILDGASRAVLVDNAITRGQWTHISMVIDIETNDVKIYVDYDCVATVNKAQSTYGYKYTPSYIRPGFSPKNPGGEFSLDNFMIYEGHSPRILGEYEGMTNEEKFSYYVDQAYNTSLPLDARKDYYLAANEARGAYLENSEMASVVEKLDSFDGETLIAQLGEYNLARLKTLIDKLERYVPTESNKENRALVLSEIDLLNGTVGAYMLRNEVYDAYMLTVSEAKDFIGKEGLAAEFVGYVNAFYGAVDTLAKEKAYQNAMGILPSINTDLFLNGGYTAFEKAYEQYREMKTILEETVCVENSKRLAACIIYIEEYNTVELWEENYEYLAGFVKIARDIINGGNYDPYYNNLSKKVENFMPMANFFYEKSQLVHEEYLGAILDRFNSTDLYFEKYGLTLHFRDYLSTNEIDLERPTVKELIEINDANFEMLIATEENYEELLLQNTASFIEICKGLVGSVDYLDMKRICAEASVYFYYMSVSDASARDAVAVYNARVAEIERIESYAESFIEATLILEAALPEDKFNRMLAAGEYLADVEYDVDGVSEARERLEAEFDAYNEMIKVANTEIMTTTQYAASASNTTGLSALISKLLALINKG